MATYADLSKLTNNELRQFTHGELNKLSAEELFSQADLKISSIAKNNPAFANELKVILSTISLNIASNMIYDAAKGTDWLSILDNFVQFLHSL